MLSIRIKGAPPRPVVLGLLLLMTGAAVGSVDLLQGVAPAPVDKTQGSPDHPATHPVSPPTQPKFRGTLPTDSPTHPVNPSTHPVIRGTYPPHTVTPPVHLSTLNPVTHPENKTTHPAHPASHPHPVNPASIIGDAKTPAAAVKPGNASHDLHTATTNSQDIDGHKKFLDAALDAVQGLQNKSEDSVKPAAETGKESAGSGGADPAVKGPAEEPARNKRQAKQPPVGIKKPIVKIPVAIKKGSKHRRSEGSLVRSSILQSAKSSSGKPVKSSAVPPPKSEKKTEEGVKPVAETGKVSAGSGVAETANEPVRNKREANPRPRLPLPSGVPAGAKKKTISKVLTDMSKGSKHRRSEGSLVADNDEIMSRHERSPGKVSPPVVKSNVTHTASRHARSSGNGKPPVISG